jgi:signal peptidase II
MQKASHLRGNWQIVAFFSTAGLTLALDQLSKIWIRSNLPVGQWLPEDGFFRLTHVRNTGGVFGLFQGQSLALIIVALVAAVFILSTLFIYRRSPFLDSILVRLAFGLILGGAIGNLIDRLSLGYITDFISVGIWPAFNLADSAVVVGVIILAYSLIRGRKHRNGQRI